MLIAEKDLTLYFSKYNSAICPMTFSYKKNNHIILYNITNNVQAHISNMQKYNTLAVLNVKLSGAYLVCGEHKY